MLFRGVRQPGGRTDVTTSVNGVTDWLRPVPRYPNVCLCPWNWGDRSPGSRRLAVAMMVFAGLSWECADMFADDLVCGVVSQFHRDHFALTSDELHRWICDVVLEDLAERRRCRHPEGGEQ